MKTVIVPVDFSANAANAAVFAAEVASFYGADLWLYYAYELPVAVGDFAYPVFDVKEMQIAAEHDMEVFKASLQSKIKTPVKINTLSELNVLQEGLSAFCDNLKPDLVVMGLSGKSALTRLVVGSNTIQTIYNLKYPVLVIPSKATFVPVRRIGFACDYNQIERNTPIGLLKKIVKDFNAELHVLNVDYHNRNFSPDAMHESFMLGEMISDLKPEYHNIESEDVTEGINWFAARAKLDMIIVIPKKHQAIQRMFNRSHTKDLIFHTHTPVLCMHQ